MFISFLSVKSVKLNIVDTVYYMYYFIRVPTPPAIEKPSPVFVLVSSMSTFSLASFRVDVELVA